MILSVSAARLRPFIATPAPDDLASVVASWDRRQQALFLIGLGAALQARYRGCAPWAGELIGHELATEESDLPVRAGSDLVLAIAGVVRTAQRVEALS